MAKSKTTPKRTKSAKIIRYLNTGIFPATVLFSMGFGHDDLVKYTKKCGQWSVGIENDSLVKSGKTWCALRRDIYNSKTGAEQIHYYIILPTSFDFKSDEDYIKLSHEVLHICQFMLKDFLDRDREFECEAYLHSHLMRQCLVEIRKAVAC